MLEFITDFFENIFYEWTTSGIIVWAMISVGTIGVAWFAPIPSAAGDTVGFPLMVKFGVTVLIPAATWYMINNKEWTADKFGKVGKRRK